METRKKYILAAVAVVVLIVGYNFAVGCSKSASQKKQQPTVEETTPDPTPTGSDVLANQTKDVGEEFDIQGMLYQSNWTVYGKTENKSLQFTQTGKIRQYNGDIMKEGTYTVTKAKKTATHDAECSISIQWSDGTAPVGTLKFHDATYEGSIYTIESSAFGDTTKYQTQAISDRPIF